MPQQVLNSVENNFSKGLLTEFTGLNFPENAATASSNVVYSLIGDTVRREGFNYEANFITQNIAMVNTAVDSYKWNNASGDGLTQFIVQQNGANLSFFNSTKATVFSPLSAQFVQTVNISGFIPAGGTFDPTQECQFSDGNGYLFVFQSTINPIFIQFNPSTNTLSATPINIQIRDQVGVLDGLQVTNRPQTLSNLHNYNIQNQGWTSANSFSQLSQSNVFSQNGQTNFTVASGLTVTNGTIIQCFSTIGIYFTGPVGKVLYTTLSCILTGTVTNYSGTTLTLNVFSTQLFGSATAPNGTLITPTANNYGGDGVTFVPLNATFFGLYSPWSMSSINTSTITTWFADEGNYPSNSDVWWYFKDSTGIFNPTATQPSVTLSTGTAPQGHYLLSAFNQDRTATSGITGITPVTTLSRPNTGCWFQGRIWYTGCNSSFFGDSTVAPYSWTETIYFSQTIQPGDSTSFGNCYQTNDPTSENLFNLLPTDGGTIQIQGSGAIYKLFSLMNALLVFAANGVWYISGGTSIGFTASDFSIVKLSAVRSISSTSVVDINGLPIFWNEEGIYQVQAAKQGQSLLNSPLHVNPLTVDPLTVGTIQSYYDDIPLQSKKYARGTYDPINYIVQWVYRSTPETGIGNRYVYDTILTYNTYNHAFYPYNFDTTTNRPPTISGIVYVQSPGGLNTPDSTIKYLVTTPAGTCTFAEENDPAFVDWRSASVSNNFISTFTTGYKLHGQASRRFQIPYVYVYSRTDGSPTSYAINTSWDYAINTNSGRVSNVQYATINNTNVSMAQRRHRLRGWGLALQLTFTSIAGQPFDIMGWSMYETANQAP